MRKPSLSVIVLNRNGREHLEECFSSLEHQSLKPDETILVDNGSTDGSADLVRIRFSRVKVIQNRKNLGFAGGNNVGIRKAKGKYIVLLNNDTVCDVDFLKELVRAAETSDEIGACAAKMRLYHARSILNSVGGCITIHGWGWDRGLWEKDEGQFDREEEVFSACGGAMLLRREALDKAGAFDETFFYFWEDMDLSWRLRLYGYRILSVPTALVYHKMGAFVDRYPARKRYQGRRNRLRSLLKNCENGTLRRILPEILREDLNLARRELPGIGVHGFLYEYMLAYLWNLLHAQTTIKERRRIQRERTVTDEALRPFFVSIPRPNCIFTPGYVTDMKTYREGKARGDRIDMGSNDLGALGAGWGELHRIGAEERPYRRTALKAFFYLTVRGPRADGLRLRLGGSSEKTLSGEVLLSGKSIGEFRIPSRACACVVFPVTPGSAVGSPLEFTLITHGGWVPHEHFANGDRRTLGISVQYAELFRIKRTEEQEHS